MRKRGRQCSFLLRAVSCVLVPLMASVCAIAAPRAVSAVSDTTIDVGDDARLPVYVSADWSRPIPDIERVIVIVHGVDRNARGYFRTALHAQTLAGTAGQRTLIIAPQFLNPIDVAQQTVPDNVLRWRSVSWEDAGVALGPRAVSSFAAFDAILARIGDRHLFPNVRELVLAGHSGGGQFIQRYAIIGRGADTLAQRGIHIRYIVANPSSYAYFHRDRPEHGNFASCPAFNQWKYGLDQLPAYAAPLSAVDFEKRYLSKEVTYLLGSLDTDPDHPDLDKTCMAEAQGANRNARGHLFYASIQADGADAKRQILYEIEGAGHRADRMFTSTCGVSALFDMGLCR